MESYNGRATYPSVVVWKVVEVYKEHRMEISSTITKITVHNAGKDTNNHHPSQSKKCGASLTSLTSLNEENFRFVD